MPQNPALVLIVVSCVVTVTGIEDIKCSEPSPRAHCCFLLGDSTWSKDILWHGFGMFLLILVAVMEMFAPEK